MKRNSIFFFLLLCILVSPAFQTEKDPVIYIIGDSTVKNGDGSGRNQQWGWGDFLENHFNTDRIHIENHAIGGRSSRTFLEEGRWERILEKLKPGDFVLIQFGHNDGGSLNKDRARGTLKGAGDETETVIIEATGKEKTIHTYGWYIRKYINEAKDKGAIPIVFSHIPRNRWKEDKIERNNDSYGKWCKEVCTEENAIFIDLNELVARHYEITGKHIIGNHYFKGDHTHTSFIGAKTNAQIIANAIKNSSSELKNYLKSEIPNRKFNFNSEWKLSTGDLSDVEKNGFDDSGWKQITLPHAFNEDEAFKLDIKDLTTGIVWYRKQFKLPSDLRNKKIFIEFEGIRQAGEFFINGKSLGIHENGITPVGFDLTPHLNFGNKQNVLAVRIDNAWNYKEKTSGSRFQWNDINFNANYGGIPKNVFLHITDKLYQTLPLYSNLGTTGIYIYADDIKTGSREATIHIESEIINEYNKAKKVRMEANIFNLSGKRVASFNGENISISPGEKKILKLSSPLSGLNFWSWGFGYLYNVETVLVVDGKPIDKLNTTTGFRKTRFADGMVWLNDRVIQLKGYAQRTSNEWPAVGISVPAWLSDYSNRLMLESNANIVRWMHIAPWKQDVESCDRVGLIQAMPAGDSEKDVNDRRWEHRKEVMRDAIIYNRNNPSIIFYECGNKGISEEHMQEMINIRNQYDPYGGRAIGSREMLDSKIAEYGGEMLYINKSARHPMWAMEYSRDEGLRKYWDNYSYPFHKDGDGPLYKDADASAYNRNQDSHAIENIMRWFDYWKERPGTGKRSSAGGVKIIFSDSNTHHRGAENYRRSGVVDAMRIPKDGFFVHQVMWDGWVDIEKSHTHIIGHWNYDPNISKDIYVASGGGEKVELFINGQSKGLGKKSHEFLYTFEDIQWESGMIKAITYNKQGRPISSDSIITAGEPHEIRLKLLTGPEGFYADGADMALIEVEVIDNKGRRCPLANNMIDFELQGNAEWRGGIAQGPDNYILATSFPVECGINRALIRSTTEAGPVIISAKAEGLKSAGIEFSSLPVKISNGMSEFLPAKNTTPDFTRWSTPEGQSYTITRIPVNIKNAKTEINPEQAIYSYDDNERTEWKNDNNLTSAWITYELEREAELNEATIKLTGWRMRSYPLEIYAGDSLVYSGDTPKSLGYITLPLKPVKSKFITIRLAGSTQEKDAFGQVTELAAENQELDLYKDPKGKEINGQLRIIETEFYECLNQ